MAQRIAARAAPPISKPRNPNLWLSFRILKIQQHYELAGREHRRDGGHGHLVDKAFCSSTKLSVIHFRFNYEKR